MKFKLKQEKLQELLEKLIVRDIFPSSIITISKDSKTDEPVLFSIQKEGHGRAFRYLKVNKDFFIEIEECEESIEVDVDRTLNVIKKINPGTELTIETEGNKLVITGEYKELDKDGNVKSKRIVAPHISYKEPNQDILREIPFKFDGNYPVIGKDKVKIDNHFLFNLEDMKEITEFAGTVKTEYYQVTMEKDNLTIRVGDLHDFSDFVNYSPRYEMKNGGAFKLILSYAVAEVADTFRISPINCMMTTDTPAWLFEKTNEYLFGVLIPPYVPDESET